MSTPDRRYSGFSILRKIPLRAVVIVPFVLQVAAIVGLVGYLSFKSGQSAVEDLATQLRSELSTRIERELRSYFEVPYNLNQINTAVFVSGGFDFASPRNLSLLQQEVRLSSFTHVANCNSEAGESIGAGRSEIT